MSALLRTGVGVLVAALLGAGGFVWWAAAGFVLGQENAMMLWVALSAVLLSCSFAASLRGALAGALIATLLVGVAGLLAPTMSSFVLAAAIAMSCGRLATSQTRTPRRVALEGLLLVTGLGLAVMLFSPTPLGWACALWVFALAQALHPILTAGSRATERPDGDAFDSAERRIDALLREPG